MLIDGIPNGLVGLHHFAIGMIPDCRIMESSESWLGNYLSRERPVWKTAGVLTILIGKAFSSRKVPLGNCWGRPPSFCNRDDIPIAELWSRAKGKGKLFKSRKVCLENWWGHNSIDWPQWSKKWHSLARWFYDAITVLLWNPRGRGFAII